MINKNIPLFFSKSGTAGIALSAALMLASVGCVGYVDGPSGSVAVAAPVVAVDAPVVSVGGPVVAVQDNYVYYPSYGIYYNSGLHQFASFRGGAWISESAPRGVSVDVLLRSPSVRMNFHDSPANHHAEVARQYPRNWKPAHAQKKPGQRDEHEGR